MRYSIDNQLTNQWEVGSGPPIGVHLDKDAQIPKSSKVSDAISLRWKESIQDEILDVAADCGKAGWDGEDARPITPDAISRAIKILYLAPDWIRPPDISPSTDGEFAFEWRNGSKLLSMHPRGDEIVFAAVLGSSNDREMGIKPVSKGWPMSAIRVLEEHFPNVRLESPPL